MYFPESLVVIIGTGLPTFLVVQLWQLACCHRLVGVTTCLRAITSNPVAEAALFIVMYFSSGTWPAPSIFSSVLVISSEAKKVWGTVYSS